MYGSHTAIAHRVYSLVHLLVAKRLLRLLPLPRTRVLDRADSPIVAVW